MKRPDCRSGLFRSWSGPVAVFFQSWDWTFKHYPLWMLLTLPGVQLLALACWFPISRTYFTSLFFTSLYSHHCQSSTISIIWSQLPMWCKYKQHSHFHGNPALPWDASWHTYCGWCSRKAHCLKAYGTIHDWVQVYFWNQNQDFFGWWGLHLVFTVIGMCDLDNQLFTFSVTL